MKILTTRWNFKNGIFNESFTSSSSEEDNSYEEEEEYNEEETHHNEENELAENQKKDRQPRNVEFEEETQHDTIY